MEKVVYEWRRGREGFGSLRGRGVVSEVMPDRGAVMDWMTQVHEETQARKAGCLVVDSEGKESGGQEEGPGSSRA